MASKDEVLYAVAIYLQSIAQDSVQKEAVQKLIDAFAIDTTESAFKSLSHFPVSLEEVFTAGAASLQSHPYEQRLAEAESNKKFSPFVSAVAAKGYYADTTEDSFDYLERHAKVLNKFKSKLGAKGAGDDKAAEDKKNEGNACISAKDYAGAVKAYTEAIDLSPEGPNSHIYYTNRAAAHCYLRAYKDAISDCKAAIAINSSYVKAFSRLGLAHFFLEQYQEAVDAYSQCVELEPENNASKESLRQATSKLEEQRQREMAPSSSSSGQGGMPDLSALLGGAGGLEGLMSNPQFAQIASEMMKNPAMMQQAMSMLNGGGGRGMPDMAQMAQMAQMMKGMDKGGN